MAEIALAAIPTCEAGYKRAAASQVKNPMLSRTTDPDAKPTLLFSAPNKPPPVNTPIDLRRCGVFT
jgi:hypothetical protein